VGNGLGRGFNSPRLHQNPLTAADNPLSRVFWLAHLLLGLGVLALGWGWTRPSVPMGRVMRRLRRLLWLSIGAKGIVWGALYTLSPAIEPPVAALGLLISGGQTLLEFAAIFWRLYPRERAERGLTASQRAYLAVRLRPVLDALTPLLTVGLAGLTAHYTLSGAYRDWGGWGALTAGGMGLGTLLMGLGITRRAAPLPVRTVSLAPSLLAEAQRLGNELGVQVREILVLDGTRTRTANAFALSGGRIALTDYLLAALTERELHAVLAHEIAHLAQRRRLTRLWALLAGRGHRADARQRAFCGTAPALGVACAATRACIRDARADALAAPTARTGSRRLRREPIRGGATGKRAPQTCCHPPARDPPLRRRAPSQPAGTAPTPATLPTRFAEVTPRKSTA
jgi:hypothetical protein